MAQLEDGSLPPSLFRHSDHLRLAWICLHQASFDDALSKVRTTIQAYAKAIGATGLYHETITTAWVYLVATHQEPNFADFLKQNTAQLKRNPLKRFYSDRLLAEETTRHRWTTPDLAPLPAHSS